MRAEQYHRVSTRVHAAVAPGPDQATATAHRIALRLRNRLGPLRVGQGVHTEFSHCTNCAVSTVVDLDLHRHLLTALDRHPATAVLVVAAARVIVPVGRAKGQG